MVGDMGRQGNFTAHIAIALAAIMLLGFAQERPSPYAGFAWTGQYEAFRTLVLEGEDLKAAAAGDIFMDQAAVDFNYHNPDFGWLAMEVGSAHHRVGHLDRAFALFNWANGAFVFSLGYDSQEAADTTGLLAEIELDRGNLDRAVALYQEAVTMAVVGGRTAQAEAFLKGLAEAYKETNPAAAKAIEQKLSGVGD